MNRYWKLWKYLFSSHKLLIKFIKNTWYKYCAINTCYVNNTILDEYKHDIWVSLHCSWNFKIFATHIIYPWKVSINLPIFLHTAYVLYTYTHVYVYFNSIICVYTYICMYTNDSSLINYVPLSRNRCSINSVRYN